MDRGEYSLSAPLWTISFEMMTRLSEWEQPGGGGGVGKSEEFSRKRDQREQELRCAASWHLWRMEST